VFRTSVFFFKIFFGFLAPADEENGAPCCNGNVSFFFGMWHKVLGIALSLILLLSQLFVSQYEEYNWVIFRLGWLRDVKGNLLSFLGSRYTDAHDVIRFAFGPIKRSGFACFFNEAYLNYWRYCSEHFCFIIIFLIILSLMYCVIVIKCCYFVFRFYLLKNIWRFLWLIVQVRLDYAECENLPFPPFKFKYPVHSGGNAH
jgi:hypothetical protein